MKVQRMWNYRWFYFSFTYFICLLVFIMSMYYFLAIITKVYLKYHLGERVGLGEDRAPAKCLAHGKFSTSTSWVNSWNSRETWVRGTKRSPGGREDRGAAREGVRFQICCVSDLQVGLFTQRDNHILGGGWILNVCRKVWTE